MRHPNARDHIARSISIMLAATVLTVLSTHAAAAGDAVNGKAVFAQCSVCHAVTPGANRIGPSLAGVVGRPAASVPNFAYSAAMRASHIVWTEPALSAYLEAPQKLVAGTKMGYAGLADSQKRADVIAYLKTRPGS